MMHLLGGFFQLGYVTKDVDEGCVALQDRFGAMEFLINSPPPLDGVLSPTRRIALAYIDDVMVEIIEPDPAQQSIYSELVPDDSSLRLHHLGYYIDDYAATLRHLSALGYSTPLHGSFGKALDYIYADTRAELGHYSEFIRLGEEGRAFFESAPRLRTR